MSATAARRPLLSLGLLLAVAVFAEPIPTRQLDFIGEYCLDCHDEATAKGDLNLELETVDWSIAATRWHWEDLFTRVQRRKMPPPKKSQPSESERADFLAWLDGALSTASPIGGTPLRRLNQREYRNTVRQLFNFPEFDLPGSFPQDLSAHGFDTNAKELVVSPSHLEAYSETAILLADRLFPPLRPPMQPKRWSIPPTDMTISYSSAAIVDGAMRLASTGIKTRNATWPTKFAAPVSGVYRLKVTSSAKQPPADPSPQLKIGAHSPYERKGKDRNLASVAVAGGAPATTALEVTLFAGETLLFAYANAPLDYTKGSKTFKPFLAREFAANPRMAAAWDKLGKVPRGGNGWARVKETMASDKSLKPERYAADSPALAKLVKRVQGNAVLTGETIVYKYFEEGPNLGIHEVEITGPHSLVEDAAAKQRRAIQAAFLGASGRSSADADVSAVLERFLSDAFRRPATESEIARYLALVKGEIAVGRPLDAGYHLVIRTALASPHFLYRERGDELDADEFAGRLSYFLTGQQPDAQLRELSTAGKLEESAGLRNQAKRLLANNRFRLAFIRDFTGQWLDVYELDNLMPDPELFPGYSDRHRQVMQREVELTFQEILTKNRPVTDFIDPDFLYTDPSIGHHVYQLANFAPKPAKNKHGKPGIPKPGAVKRIALARGTRRGGLLAMPAVMTATANGVDTQAVLRGVWTLENILGMPPPPPPKGVPPLPPSTAGATTPKERLAAHMASPSCASCHQDIDPVGFVLENFDPVGRWRTTYPTRNPKEAAIAVDASGTLPDGTELQNVVDLKKWLVGNPEHFANCLARKLLEYGTGRPLNYRERKIVAEICADNLQAGEGFEDLLLDLIDSAVFRAR